MVYDMLGFTIGAFGRAFMEAMQMTSTGDLLIAFPAQIEEPGGKLCSIMARI